MGNMKYTFPLNDRRRCATEWPESNEDEPNQTIRKRKCQQTQCLTGWGKGGRGARDRQWQRKIYTGKQANKKMCIQTQWLPFVCAITLSTINRLLCPWRFTVRVHTREYGENVCAHHFTRCNRPMQCDTRAGIPSGSPTVESNQIMCVCMLNNRFSVGKLFKNNVDNYYFVYFLSAWACAPARA